MFFFCATECCDRGNIKARVGVSKQQPYINAGEGYSSEMFSFSFTALLSDVQEKYISTCVKCDPL